MMNHTPFLEKVEKWPQISTDSIEKGLTCMLERMPQVPALTVTTLKLPTEQPLERQSGAG